MNILPEKTEKSSRHGRGKAKQTIDLTDTAANILREIQPATVRAVCYRLFVAGVLPDMSKASTGKVSKQLVWARENDVIPWHWVVDETRGAERASLWNSPDEIIDSAVHGYRRDYWIDQPRWIEVWSEKGTVRGTLAPVLNRFGVAFRVMHGYGSATALHDTADETGRADKPLMVLYVGDWDCSGLHMSEADLPERLARYGGQASIHRIALTADDVGMGTTLPHFLASSKIKDPRYEWFVTRYGTRCWELDALPPPELRGRVEECIKALIDHNAWNRSLLVEKAEVDSMRMYVGEWKKSISRQVSKYSSVEVQP